MVKEASEQRGDWGVRWGLLVADIWEDDALRKRLLSDPATVLRERGMEVAPNVQIKVTEDSPKVMNLVIPEKPSEAELSEQELQTVAGGGKCGHGCSGHGCGHKCGHGCGGCGGGCGQCGACVWFCW